MCNNTVHRPTASFNGIVDPFSFSTLHLLRTCNRLMLPTDMRNYYTLLKDSNNNNNNSSIIENDKNLIKSPIKSLKLLEISTPSQTTTEYQNSFLPTQIYPKEISPIISNVTSSGCSPPNFEYSSSEYSTGGASNQLIGGDFNSYTSILSRRQRGEKRAIPNEQKDEKYYERRKRNNEAAKKSRDARKMREDRIAFRAALLEQENAILRAQMLAMRDEMNTLRQMLGRT